MVDNDERVMAKKEENFKAKITFNMKSQYNDFRRLLISSQQIHVQSLFINQTLTIIKQYQMKKILITFSSSFEVW